MLGRHARVMLIAAFGLLVGYPAVSAAAVAASPTPEALKDLATVSGTVTAAKPFKWAQVYLRNTDKQIQYMVFTSAGAFRAAALFPGHYDVTVRAVGLESTTQKLVLKKAGKVTGLKVAMHDAKDPNLWPSSVDVSTDHLFNAAGWNDPGAKFTLASYDEIYPPGPGRKVLENVCFSCHGDQTFALAPRSPDAWKYALDYMRGVYLTDTERHGFGEGALAGSASNFRFSVEDRKVLLDYLSKNLGPDKSPRAVRTDLPVPFDPDVLAKAELIEYYVGKERSAKENAKTEATVGSESDVTAIADAQMLITMQLDTDGNVWAVDRAVPSQLVRLDPRTGEQKFYILPNPKAGVHDLVIDREGIIWVTEFTSDIYGTGSADIQPPRLLGFNPKTEKWDYLVDADPDNVIDALPKGPLMAPTVDSKGNIYANWMLRGAIVKYDRTKNRSSVFRMPTPSSTPYGAAIDGHDNVWAALWNFGKLARFDTSVNQWTEFTPPTQPANMRRGPGVDSQNNVWVGIWAGGPRPGKIAKLDPTNSHWTEWTIPHRGGQPYETTADREGNIWFPETGGPDSPSLIGKLEPKTGKFTFYPRLQFVADSSRLEHTTTGAVWYAPRYGATPGNSGFGALYPDKDQITTLAAYPINGTPGYVFNVGAAAKSAN
jgi:streptogramin lyase/mono/diheme cytochrome c family protein